MPCQHAPNHWSCSAVGGPSWLWRRAMRNYISQFVNCHPGLPAGEQGITPRFTPHIDRPKRRAQGVCNFGEGCTVSKNCPNLHSDLATRRTFGPSSSSTRRSPAAAAPGKHTPGPPDVRAAPEQQTNSQAATVLRVDNTLHVGGTWLNAQDGCRPLAVTSDVSAQSWRQRADSA